MTQSTLRESCIEATGALHGGYVRIKRGGVKWYAHRWEYTQKVRPLLPGEILRHACDNRRCINVDHLIPGTHHENSIDKVMRAARFDKLKLLPEQLPEVRAMIAEGTRYRVIAEKFGVSRSCIKHIATDRNWSHLKEVT